MYSRQRVDWVSHSPPFDTFAVDEDVAAVSNVTGLNGGILRILRVRGIVQLKLDDDLCCSIYVLDDKEGEAVKVVVPEPRASGFVETTPEVYLLVRSARPVEDGDGA